MNEKLTTPQLLHRLGAIVERKGRDYVYPDAEKRQIGVKNIPQCVYFTEDDQPSCIIGHLLDDLGYDAEEIKQFEGKGARHVASELGLTPRFPAYDDNLPGRVLEMIQLHQDDGRTWGEAFDKAKDLYRSYLPSTGK